ncbi:MAG: DUF308 domain-containing protein [Clostridia bacterium]|nr:DUF308 domain-containing protein [Clostridia bacterium]
MKKSEKIISAIFTIAIGVLLMVMKGEMISVFMTILGVSLIVLGAIDLLQRNFPLAVVKIVVGSVVILFGWTIVSAVVYVLAAIVLIVGILALYDCIRFRLRCIHGREALKILAMPIICIFIGLILFFNKWDWVFVVAGLFTIFEGGLLLLDALYG